MRLILRGEDRRVAHGVAAAAALHADRHESGAPLAIELGLILRGGHAVARDPGPNALVGEGRANRVIAGGGHPGLAGVRKRSETVDGCRLVGPRMVAGCYCES